MDKKEYRRLQDRAYRAQQKDQSEVCGALVCNGEHLHLKFLKNHSPDRGSFLIKLAEVRPIRKELQGTKYRVVGYFHSHIVSEAIPGERDISEALINSLMLIYDVCGREAKLYRVVGPKVNKSVSSRRLNYA